MAAQCVVWGSEEAAAKVIDEIANAFAVVDNVEAAENSREKVVRIENKYYVAQVTTKVVPGWAHDEEVFGNAQAGIIALMPGQLEQMKEQVISEWERIGDREMLECRMVVVFGDEVQVDDSLLDSLVDFNVELVTQEEFYRIKEALEVTMWSSMVKHDQKEEKPDLDEGGDDKCESEGLPLDEVTGECVGASGPAVTFEDADVGDKFFASLLNSEELHSNHEEEVDATLKDLSDFESLINKVKDLRMNTGSLSDEERRKTAASLALQLAAALDIDDDDE